MPAPFTVLLMASGGPGGPGEIESFLAEARGGAATPAELAALRQRYQRVGGRSPIREITEAQRVALSREVGTAVYAGMRHGRPSLAEAVDRIAADGHRRVVGLVMAPHYSAFTVGDAEKKLIAAAKGRLELGLVRSWGDHIGFVRAVEHHVRQALQRFDAPRKVPVVFTGPSIPQSVAARGDSYAEQLRDSAAAIAGRLRLTTWRVAYHVPPAVAEAWLGPDPPDVFARLAGEGYRDVLVVPLGWVSDQLEIQYDVDVDYRDRAAALGLRLERTTSLNDDPDLIRCLSQLARSEAAEREWQ